MPGTYFISIRFKVGEILHLKKQHPCGGWLWQVERIGADIGLKCLTCGRFMVMPRQKLEKAVKSVSTGAEQSPGSAPRSVETQPCCSSLYRYRERLTLSNNG